MSFNGSGTFQRTNGTNSGSTTWNLDATAGTKILASRHDTHDQDIADGLTNCICKDGQTTPTANLPMGGYAHTNVAAATARTQYARASQIQDGALVWGGTSTGAANVYAITLSPAVTAYATGMRVAFLSHQTNTGACTLNINNVAATAIKLVATTLEAGRIISGAIVECEYDGTNFQLLNTTPVSGGIEVLSTGGFQRSALSGDVSASAGSNTTAIGADKVTSSMVRFANNSALRMNDSGGTAVSVLYVDTSSGTILNTKTGTIMQLAVAGAGVAQVQSTFLGPGSDNGATLGTGSFHWANLFTHLLNVKASISLAAAGSVQGDATAITNAISTVTTTGAGQGVILPSTASTNDLYFIRNNGSNSLNIYPPSGGTVAGGAANAPLSLAGGLYTLFICNGTDFVKLANG